MHFFDKPSKSKIALRGSSRSTASSAEVLAAARRQRADRAAARAREAAALAVQRAVRARLAHAAFRPRAAAAAAAAAAPAAVVVAATRDGGCGWGWGRRCARGNAGEAERGGLEVGRRGRRRIGAEEVEWKVVLDAVGAGKVGAVGAGNGAVGMRVRLAALCVGLVAEGVGGAGEWERALGAAEALFRDVGREVRAELADGDGRGGEWKREFVEDILVALGFWRFVGRALRRCPPAVGPVVDAVLGFGGDEVWRSFAVHVFTVRGAAGMLGLDGGRRSGSGGSNSGGRAGGGIAGDNVQSGMLRGRPFAERLLAALAAENPGLDSLLDAEADGELKKEGRVGQGVSARLRYDGSVATVLLANILAVSKRLWGVRDTKVQWQIVSVVATLVRRMPESTFVRLHGEDDDDDDDVDDDVIFVDERDGDGDVHFVEGTNGGGGDGSAVPRWVDAKMTDVSVARDLMDSLKTIVSDSSVRALFSAAVAEGRHATVRVCQLFVLLTRRDPQLRMDFQSSIAFWRNASTTAAGPAEAPHILKSLWALCSTGVGQFGSAKDNGGLEAPPQLDLSGEMASVLLVFVRAYSHFLYVQDEDEMFETGRPFSVAQVQEIAQVLKNALFLALYGRTSSAPSTFASSAAFSSSSFAGSGGNASAGQTGDVWLDRLESAPIGIAATTAAAIRNEPDLLDGVSRLLSALYVVDSRHQFRTSDDFWIAGSGVLASNAFVQDAVDAGADAVMAVGNAGGEAGFHGYGGSRSSKPSASRKPGASGAGELLRVAPYMAPFSSRAKIFQMWVEAERKRYAGPAALAGLYGNWVTIRRSYLFEDAFDKLYNLKNELKRSLRIKFIDEHGIEEAGIDGGGVYKEFLYETLRRAFSPSLYGLFLETSDGCLYPNPAAHIVDEGYVERFEFVGALLGKALFDGVIVDIPLASFFLSKMLRKFNYPSDLRSLDPELYKNIMFLRKCDDPEIVESLGLNFVAVSTAYGKTKEKELVRGGSNVPVTAQNRIEYIHRVSNHRMNVEIKRQSDAFIRGFSSVIRPEYISLFSERELQLLLSGTTGALDVADLRRNTKYSGGYTEDSDVIRWFWRAVDELSAEDQSRLLQFVTSSPRAPLLGFTYLNPSFCVHRAEGDARLPTASTCMNLLKLPHYKDYDTLRAKLQYSLESNSGFDLS